MVSTSYYPSLKLKLSHLYYQERNCPDIALVPTASCGRLLQRHRCILKGSQDQLVVLIPVDADQNPVVPFNPSSVFTFELILKNPDFVSYTTLDPGFSLGKTIFRYSNKSIKTSKNKKKKDFSSTILADTHLEPIATLEKVSGKGQLLGVVDLYIDQLEQPGKEASKTQNYIIEFTPNSKNWWYCLIVDDSMADDSFSIVDSQGKLKFKRIKQLPPHYKKITIHNRLPHSKAILFESEDPIGCSEQGVSSLQLLKKVVKDEADDSESEEASSQIWIPALPNPTMRNPIRIIHLLKDI